MQPLNNACPELSLSLRCRQVRALHSSLPAFVQVNPWQLLFSTERDGHSLQSLLRQAADHAPTLLALTDTNGHTFGCYATAPWDANGASSSSSSCGAEFIGGGGECFLWRWSGTEGALAKSTWTREASLFQLGGGDCIGMGGGGDTYGLWIDRNLDQGSSGRCTTFDNPVLCRDGAGAEESEVSTASEVVLASFQVETLELWGL